MIAADLRVFADAGALAAAAAREVAHVLVAATREHGSASMALSGGRTPRDLYQCLALDHRHDTPWGRVHVYWGDERNVPHDDDRSNYRMARESLLDHVPVRAEHVYPMPTVLGEPGRAAAAYERTLRSQFDAEWPRFDIVLLGIGDDGHTASLFPGSAALTEARRWVVATTAPVEPRGRLTLTLPALTHATAMFVLVAGRSKADALRRALGDRPDPRCPASLLHAARAPVVWWADAEAAAHLGSRSSR
ncbi:MAG: 6-phosphogluconolactonase [Acidobacteria bacterium]|nr:6-phosphogluconolactonase [Acidobacteriota bacterium]